LVYLPENSRKLHDANYVNIILIGQYSVSFLDCNTMDS